MNLITYDAVKDSDSAPLRGRWWSEVKLNGEVVPVVDRDGVQQPAATNFWLKCRALRDAKRRADELAAQREGAVVRRV